MVTELCTGTLTDFVDRVKHARRERGLPSIDVVTLGMMLLDALTTIHEYAKSLHMDVKPDNVLIAALAPGQDESAPRSIRLADFGLAMRLPTRITSKFSRITKATVVDGVRGETPGYASPEQCDGQGRRASDVYSAGATMLFAATSEQPYGDKATAQFIMKKHIQRAVPSAGMPVAAMFASDCLESTRSFCFCLRGRVDVGSAPRAFGIVSLCQQGALVESGSAFEDAASSTMRLLTVASTAINEPVPIATRAYEWV